MHKLEAVYAHPQFAQVSYPQHLYGKARPCRGIQEQDASKCVDRSSLTRGLQKHTLVTDQKERKGANDVRTD